jgi:hypothetical protein
MTTGIQIQRFTRVSPWCGEPFFAGKSRGMRQPRFDRRSVAQCRRPACKKEVTGRPPHGPKFAAPGLYGPELVSRRIL